jgi:hypothetical protein
VEDSTVILREFIGTMKNSLRVGLSFVFLDPFFFFGFLGFLDLTLFKFSDIIRVSRFPQ